MATRDRGEAVAHVRKRPGMYIGSTGPLGVQHLLFEVIGNAFDEVLAGRGQTISVLVRGDGAVEIADDGPGLGAGRPDQEALLRRNRPGRHTTKCGSNIVLRARLSCGLDAIGVTGCPAKRWPGPVSAHLHMIGDRDGYGS